MNFFELEKNDKLILSTQDIANILSIKKESAKVAASRYTSKGLLIRLKQDFYITQNKFNNLTEVEFFRLANLLQTPSYISLTSALSYYNISTQQQQKFIESIAIKRAKNIQVKEVEFEFILIKKELYDNFIQKDDFFIALPEKALADAIYLTSLRRYNCDFEAINFKKINKRIVNYIIKKTNSRTIKFWSNLCKTYKI